MDHSEAVRTRVAERYLLNELTGDERDAFEEHYFSCQECAEEIRCGAILMENLREIVLDTPSTTFPAPRIFGGRSFRFQSSYQVFASAAIVLLATVVGYQSLVLIPRLRRGVGGAVPQALTSVSLLASASRGSQLPVVQVGMNQPFGLYLDIPPQSGFDAFLCEVRTDSKVEFTVRIPKDQAIETVHLLVPGDKLKPGRYNLVVRGIASNSAPNAGPEVVRYSFQVENKQ
jgi:hypothetical protein